MLFGFCAASGDIRRDIRFAKKELDESVQYRYPENKIEEIRSRIARLEDDGETAYRLARRLVEEDKADPEDKSNSGKTAWDAAIENKAMKIAAFLSGSDPDVDELSALHGNMDIFQAMYMKDMEIIVVDSDEVNAYTTMGSVVVVYTGLLDYFKKQEEEGKVYNYEEVGLAFSPYM